MKSEWLENPVKAIADSELGPAWPEGLHRRVRSDFEAAFRGRLSPRNDFSISLTLGPAVHSLISPCFVATERPFKATPASSAQ